MTNIFLALHCDNNLRLAQDVISDGWNTAARLIDDVWQFLHDTNFNTLRYNSIRMKWATQETLNDVQQRVETGQRTYDQYPTLYPKPGSNIFRLIREAAVMNDRSEAVLDGSCPLGYVIDLDAMRIEILQIGDLEEGDRFFPGEAVRGLKKTSEFDLLNLPSQQEFRENSKYTVA